MAHEFNCTNCGKTGYGSSGSGPAGGSNPPSGWITKWASTKCYCSNKCKDEYLSRNSSSKSNESSTAGANQSHAETAKYEAQASKAYAEAEKIRAEGEEDRLWEEQELKKKEKLESKIKEIATLELGVTKEEISNVLDQLVIIGSSNPSPKERKAIFDKMEIGIMKLKKTGESDCSYYESKMVKIKPTFWQKIGYYFANN